MRKPFLLSLLVALLTTIATHAYNFKSGDLYYDITSGTTVKVTCQKWLSEFNYQGLTTATIPETVTYNGTTYSVTSIGDYAFFGCSSLTSITIPNSVTSIGGSAFRFCFFLTSIILPNSVTSIGDYAFDGCSSITSITIPNSVTSIGESAFDEVPNIVYSGTATGTPWGARSVNGHVNGYLIYADETKTTLLACSAAATGEVTLPNSVTRIEGGAFEYCSSLTSITLPNSVTSIGNAAFYYCSSLTSITIPNSVTSIGDSAFYNCSSLTSIILPNSVTSIGDEAFRYCRSLTSITIPNSVTSIGDEAFASCSSLTSITIPNSVTSIGDEAFYYCSSLTSITIPNSVTSIGKYAFYSCSSLTSIVVESGNTVYDSRENCNAIIETASNTLIAGCQSTTLPNSVTSIGNYAFYQCFFLTSITLPNSVTSIGERAFSDCSVLTSITIGNSVTSIGDYAFAWCSALTSITCLATIPPTCISNSFHGVPRTIPLYVPAESVEEYKAADTWNEFDVQALLSTDATLSSLTYDGMLVPSFDADTLHYTVDLPSETSTLPQVDAVANDLGAQITIHQAAALPGEASVEVLAADKTTRQTYTIYFSKKSTPTGISDSPDTTETASDKGATKLLRDGQVLILRNGETYNMMGQRM